METRYQRARPLGPCEIYSSSRHALGFYKCVINTCRYTVPLSRVQSQSVHEVFKRAIASVVLDTPSLSVGIKDEETSNPYFVFLSSINLDHHLEYLELSNDLDNELIQKLEHQHNQCFSDISSQPPWKVTIASIPPQRNGFLAFDVIFAVHHSIADGRSTAAFHLKLLNELVCPSARPIPLSNHILRLPPNKQLSPPLEEVVTFTQSWSFMLGTLLRELGPAWFSKSPTAISWTGKPITPEPFQTNLRLIVVPSRAVPSVLAACRQHGTTLTPLLHSLVLASLAKLVPAQDAQAFCSSTPIDLRPFSDNPPGKTDGVPFGVFVTTQTHHFGSQEIHGDWDEDSIWKTAVSLKGRIKEHLGAVPKDDIMSMLSWVSDWRKFWLSKIGTRRENTWEVSNIGSIRGISDRSHSQPGWQIRRSIMSQGATAAGAAIGVNVAGVSGGDICITLSWQEGIVETNLVERVVLDLQRWLGQLGHGGQLGWD
ncbi:alcohol acetyltransferase [Cercophora samala]|uniref:Alcohol acetyltransferase n=1 Tax=Cercophora samala TaxID=330535 RepID=A0AA39ZKN0_9PEZI|nr:alcohol acetyltransferase [Cercophora samala]